jgi:hypothetical protein
MQPELHSGPVIMERMEAALIGLVGVLLGAFLGEYFRRRNRIEAYSQKIFERRLEIYEGLVKLFRAANNVADGVMTASELTHGERQSLISSVIGPLAEYADNNALYIDAYVGAHVTAVYMGAEDVQSISDPIKREAEIAEFRALYKSTMKILLQESGVHEIAKHFRSVSRSQPDSPIIGRIKELERDHE